MSESLFPVCKRISSARVVAAKEEAENEQSSYLPSQHDSELFESSLIVALPTEQHWEAKRFFNNQVVITFSLTVLLILIATGLRQNDVVGHYYIIFFFHFFCSSSLSSFLSLLSFFLIFSKSSRTLLLKYKIKADLNAA